jgi:hypothetical protein
MRWMWMVTLFALIQVQGIMVIRAEVKIPPPEKRLSYDEARRLHRLFEDFLRRHFPSEGPWQNITLPEEYIRLLERLLLDFPNERYLLERGLGLGERIERGYVHSWLAYAYRVRSEWDKYLALAIQDLLIGWLENLESKAGLKYGFPAFPFPDPFRGDPPAAIVWLAQNIQEAQRKGVRFSPLIFLRGWCLRVKWKGENPEDALVSLNDFAYALFGERWRERVHHDWKTWRFTLSLQDKTLTFSAGSPKGVVSGKEVQLRHPVERSFYDLYVPLGDLVRLVGGSLRPPKPGELEVFRRHLPVSLLVIE